MPAYDEVLAQRILVALQELFPNRVSSHELKARLSLAEVPEDRWMLALDALLRLRLIDGKILRDGSALVAAANLEITPEGRQNLSTAVTRAVPTNTKHDEDKNSTTLVTIGGECFNVKPLNVGHAGGRDGFLHLFRLTDRRTDNRERTISIFVSATDRALIENYLERLPTIRLNVIRRAFDSGTFNFETTINPSVYPELILRATDVMLQKKADDDKIRRFIKFGAYFLGFKFARAVPNLYVDFDCAEDLEYLGATGDDMHRNVRYLTQKGYLVASSLATYANPSRCSPTTKLIDEIEQLDIDPPQHSPQPIGGIAPFVDAHRRSAHNFFMSKTIFISCGQYTAAEKQLGTQISKMVRELTDCEPFFAEEVQDLNGLDANILTALRDCVGFITVMHPRGEVKRPNGAVVRASVWIEQEIAIATYIQRVEKRKLPIIAFRHKSVCREGIRDLLQLNPFEFTDEKEILAALPQRLAAWRSLRPSGINLQMISKPLGRQEGHDIRRLEIALVNDTNFLIEKYEIEVQIPSGVLSHWSASYPAEVRRDTPGLRHFRFDQMGRGPLSPHSSIRNPVTFEYCSICAMPPGENLSIGAIVVSELKLSAIAWVDGREFAVEKTIKDLTIEGAFGAAHT